MPTMVICFSFILNGKSYLFLHVIHAYYIRVIRKMLYKREICLGNEANMMQTHDKNMCIHCVDSNAQELTLIPIVQPTLIPSNIGTE